MTQAFYTSISGMAAGQNKITVVADNVANMNTIGFKSSNVNFSDVYYRTSSTGQSPTGQMGGINPKQTGIGVQTASIARDFSAGTTLTTGLNTDLCINGSSFFTVASPTVEILYTRDGNFTVDANGNLVTSSTTPIKIPTYINTVTAPSTAAQMGTKMLSDLNGIKSGGITAGTFNISSFTPAGVETTHTINVSDNMSVNGLVDAINNGCNTVTASIVDGKIQVAVKDTTTTASIKCSNITSNVVTQLGIGKMDTTTNACSSDIINYHQTIGEGTPGSEDSQNYTSLSITENGIIEVKYGNNDTMSVMQDPDDSSRMIFKYTLNDGTIITGNDLTIKDG